MSVLYLLIALLVQTPDEPYQRFSAAYATLDAQRVGAIYTDDALYLPPGGDIIRGRAAIEDRYEQGFREDRRKRHTRRISFEPVDRVVSGDIRNDIGYYTIESSEPGGHRDTFRGKFVKVWRRGGDGVWRIRTDSYSAAARP